MAAVTDSASASPVADSGQFWRNAPILEILFASFVARLHTSSTLYALLFVAAGQYGSYGQAGLVTGALVLGQGVTAPMRGRWVDRRPVVGSLIATSVVYGGAVIVLALLAPSLTLPWLTLAALLTGLLFPPCTQAARARLAQCADGETLRRVFTAQSTGNELMLVLGPGLTAMLIALTDAATALLLSGVVAIIGGVALAAAIAHSGANHPAVPAQSLLGRLRLTPPLVRAGLATVAVVVGFAAVEFIILAWADQRSGPALGGILTAVWALSSVVGGLVAAASSRVPTTSRAVALVAVAIAAFGAALCSAEIWPVALALVLGGTVIPAAIGGLYQLLSDQAGDRRGEVFGWLASLTTAGTAAINPIVGTMIDHSTAALTVVVPVALVAAAWVLIRRL